MELHATPRIADIDPRQWNRLAGADNPFLRHEFLAALERHEAVAPHTGWAPHHLALYDGGTLVAAAPAYLKSHSWGEFVFDFAWADAYERHGLDYYPKLVVAVPFSPVNGPRMLVDPTADAEALRAALADGARAMTDQLSLSSAHWLFPRGDEVDALAARGYQLRVGCQYHWHNAGYHDFEEFLAGLASKKRKNIRRERRRVREAGVRLRTVHGDEADGQAWTAMHAFYARTFREHGNLPLISRDCFAEIGRNLGDRVVLILAEADGEIIAGALCLCDDETLYGRYWGARVEVEDLHFEACYYQGIDYCIRHGLTRFEPGAQGEHKVARGFLPTLTYSAHYLADPRFRAAVGDFLARERAAVEAYAEDLTMEGPYRAEVLERLRHDL